MEFFPIAKSTSVELRRFFFYRKFEDFFFHRKYHFGFTEEFLFIKKDLSSAKDFFYRKKYFSSSEDYFSIEKATSISPRFVLFFFFFAIEKAPQIHLGICFCRKKKP